MLAYACGVTEASCLLRVARRTCVCVCPTHAHQVLGEGCITAVL